MGNKVKPTEKQRETMKHLTTAKTLQEAMLAGGYTKQTAMNPRQNFIDAAGTQELFREYREYLVRAGVSPEILAEIEVAGLFEENGAIRLGYLREVKKSLGLIEEKSPINIDKAIVMPILGGKTSDVLGNDSNNKDS